MLTDNVVFHSVYLTYYGVCGGWSNLHFLSYQTISISVDLIVIFFFMTDQQVNSRILNQNLVTVEEQ